MLTPHKARFIRPWKTFCVGDTIEKGLFVDLRDLIRLGYAVAVDETETPARPAKLARKAAEKVAAGAKSLFA